MCVVFCVVCCVLRVFLACDHSGVEECSLELQHGTEAWGFSRSMKLKQKHKQHLWIRSVKQKQKHDTEAKAEATSMDPKREARAEA